MTSKALLQELVRNARLQATIENDVTVHTRPLGRRRRVSWKRQHILGHGGSGLVWLESRVKDEGQADKEERRAVKGIRISGPMSEGRHYVRELEALANFSQDKYSEFFVKFLGWYESPGWLYIAMEYCENGDLKKYLSDVKRLPEDQAQDIASQVLSSVALMHEEGFAHRDIKPANILIQTMPPMDWVVKVCDLGLSKRSEDIAGATTMRGTPGFMPPEFLGFSGNPRTADAFMADMWCLGETVFQAITGRPTFESIADLARYQTGAVAFPDGALRQVGATEAAISFVQLLMMPRPWERLTAPMALDHPWMSTVRGPAAHIPRLTSSQTSTSTWVPDLPRLAGDQLTQASGQWTTTTPFEQQSSRGRRRLSTDQSPQSILDRRMRRTSRSPSPLGHARTFSVGTNTALPPSVPFPQVGAYIVRDARPLVVNGSVSAYSASPGNGPGHPSIVPSRGRGGPYQPVYDSRLGPYGSSLANSRYQVPVFRPMPYASYDYYLSTMTPQRIQAPYNMPPYISPVGATPSVILPTSDRARNPQIPPIGIPSPGTLALPSSPFYQSGQNERYGVDHPQLQPPAARSPTLPNSATFVKPPKHRAITIKSLDGSVFKPPPRATVPNRAEASDVKSDPLTVSAAVKQPSPGEAASASVVAPPPSGLNAKQGRDTGTNYSDSTEAAVPKDFGTSAAASQRGKYSKEVQVKWSELKKFAESFKLSTPMPTDLTHIITPGSNKRGSETKFDGKPKHGGVGTNRKSVSQTEIATKSGNSGGVQGPLYLASPPPQRRTTLASPAVRQLNEVEAKFRQGWREGGEQQDHDENEWEVVTSRRKRGSKQQLRGKGATADVTHHLAKG